MSEHSAEADDPFEQRLRQAREGSEGSSLPSESGLGPGAGETPPSARVEMDPTPDGKEVAEQPTLIGVRRHGSRPPFKSSQLDGVEESSERGSPEARP